MLTVASNNISFSSSNDGFIRLVGERKKGESPPPRNDLDCSSLMICFRIPMKTDHFAMPKWLHTHSMGRSFVRELPLGKTNDIAQHLNIIAVLLIAGYNIK